MNWGKRSNARSRARDGIALVPTILIISGLAVFMMALVTTVLSGQKTVLHQEDDHKLTSTAESTAILAAEAIWSGYLAGQGGASGNIASFRDYLTIIGIPNDPDFDFDDPEPPGASEGVDFMAAASIPGAANDPELNNAHVNSLRVVRRDIADSTQIFITTQVTTDRGGGLLDPLNRAVQQVYTVEPADFEGFNYALLANNVNCIFCHTSIDSVDRYFNLDVNEYGNFERVKVGTLESLMVRHNLGGNPHVVNDGDTDSFVAGTLYTRGQAMLHDGSPISDWSDLSFRGFQFDGGGNIMEDSWGQMNHVPFSPAGDPPGALENLYLNYSSDYADMVDGPLPTSFPAPIPDDGGQDPVTGLPDPLAAGNRIIDDVEFDAVAGEAEGNITGGVVNVTAPGDSIDTVDEFQYAFFEGNTQNGLHSSVDGNVILYGTEDQPIRIDGTLAIDGDLIISGFIEGEGSLVVRGNIYMPSDLQYKDGREYLPGDLPGEPTGPRTFGISESLDKNAVGFASGGNIMVGDFMRPMRLQPDFTNENPGGARDHHGQSQRGLVLRHGGDRPVQPRGVGQDSAHAPGITR